MRLTSHLVRDFAAHLVQFPKAQRAGLVKAQAKAWGVSAATIRRRLRKDASFALGKDLGKRTSYISDNDVRTVMKTVVKSIRKERAALTIPKAIEICQREGILESTREVNPSRLAARAREMGISAKQLLQPNPCTSLRSLYGNHMHQLDASICIQWDFDDKKETFKWRYVDFHKIDKTKKIKKAVHRWILADHLSGTFLPLYFDSPGERVEDMLRALFYYWSPKEDSRIPFCGLPTILYVDRGPAFMAKALQHLCKALGVELIWHGAGLANATGSVERSHWGHERTFESKLRIQKIRTIKELKEKATLEAILTNATKIHTRHKMPRFDAWTKAVKRPIRIPVQDFEQFCWLAYGLEETRTLKNHRKITWYGKPFFIPSGEVGETITIRPHPFEKGMIKAFRQLEGHAPVEIDAVAGEKDDWGFDLNSNVVGERHTALPATKQAILREEAKQMAPFQHAFLETEDLPEDEFGWDPIETEEVGRTEAAALPNLSRFEAKDLVIQRLDRPLTRSEGVWWNAKIKEEVHPDYFELIWDEFDKLAQNAA